MIINELVKLMEDINMKEIPEGENPKNQSILFREYLI